MIALPVARQGAARILELVSGIGAPKRWQRLFVVLQAYIDDSHDRHVHVLAGYIAPVGAWLEFSTEWRKQLNDFGMSSFTMSQLARQPDGMQRAEVFYRIIEKHVIASVSCTTDKQDLVKVIRVLPDLMKSPCLAS